MKTYKVIVTISSVFNVNAESEDDAKNILYSNLLQSNQIKPSDPITFQVIDIAE